MSGSPVLCASDLGHGSDEAVRRAHAEALAVGAPLHVLHVLPNALRHHPLFPQLYTRESADFAALESRTSDVLSRRVAALTGRDSAEVRVEVDTGTAYAEIVRRAEELHARLVVVGGRLPDGTARHLIGETAEKVVRHAHCPVLVARPGPASGRLLAATDLSDPSLPAVSAAAERAIRSGMRLTLLHVIDLRTAPVGLGLDLPPGGFQVVPDSARAELRRWAEEKLAEALRRYGVEGEPRVVEGVPATEILRQADEARAELIAMGTEGATGIARMLLGSVAEAVVRWAPCSVLVVRLHPDREGNRLLAA